MSVGVERVSDRLVALDLRLGLAESCTGGLLAARLTHRPGASRFLTGAVVPYSDEMKTRLLGVRPTTLSAHGSVSEAVVREMLQGALRACQADAAIAITGIAGPDGGTADKPVGTVWIGAAVHGVTSARMYRFQGDRGAVREASVQAALEMLYHTLEEVD